MNKDKRTRPLSDTNSPQGSMAEPIPMTNQTPTAIVPIAQSSQFVASAPHSLKNPGRNLGIVGLIMAFIFSPVGIILNTIALSKSRKAGFKNGLALGGLITSIFLTVLGLVLGLVLGIFLLTTLQGLVDRTFGHPGSSEKDLVDKNLIEKCPSLIPYKAFSYGGGEGMSKGYAKIAICGDKIISGNNSAEFLSPNYNYSYHETIFVDEPKINNLFPKSIYLITKREADSHINIYIMLNGDKVADIINYKTGLISILDDYREDYNSLWLTVYLTSDSSFNDGHHRALLAESEMSTSFLFGTFSLVKPDLISPKINDCEFSLALSGDDNTAVKFDKEVEYALKAH